MNLGKGRVATDAACCLHPQGAEGVDVLAETHVDPAKEQQIREPIERGQCLYDLLKLGDVQKSLGGVEK